MKIAAVELSRFFQCGAVKELHDMIMPFDQTLLSKLLKCPVDMDD